MIRTFDYLRSFTEIEQEVIEALQRVLHSGQLILGPETTRFEEEFADYVGARYCVGVTSGTTAIHMALAALDVGPSDEVLTVANTCAPTVAAIRLTGGVPLFVDINDEDLMMDVGRIEAGITYKTRCILPVHLWGHAANLDALLAIAERHGIPVVEDCAQAHGTTWKGRAVGTFGAAGCFSFYPTKNIGAFGDAGAVVTDDAALAARLRRLRMYGYKQGSGVADEEGLNGRISEMQAAILRVKLRVYPQWLERRKAVAQHYETTIRNSAIRRPRILPHCEPSYHQYVVRLRARDALANYLSEQGIQTGIHYPVPVHRMPAYQQLPRCPDYLRVTERASREILSLPIHESISIEEVDFIAAAINRFRA